MYQCEPSAEAETAYDCVELISACSRRPTCRLWLRNMLYFVDIQILETSAAVETACERVD